MSPFLRHKAVSFRNIVFTAAVASFLWSSYYTFSLHSNSKPIHPTDRAQHVKNAFLHAYRGYEQHAWGFDELKPLSNGNQDKCVSPVLFFPSWLNVSSFNGWGVSIIDSLDTMYIMGLHDEFNRAVAFVEQSDFSLPHVRVSVSF